MIGKIKSRLAAAKHREDRLTGQEKTERRNLLWANAAALVVGGYLGFGFYYLFGVGAVFAAAFTAFGIWLCVMGLIRLEEQSREG